ncbi:hypothetical protein BKA69DRAFT_1057414 [Paraphysoderma sedebokerense]|nr:hypothetical protein BKA69DRAFT_1057414 [Paraphysoderma sedebokerense]
MIGIDIFVLITVLCLQSHELLRLGPELLRNSSKYQIANFAQVALTVVVTWIFIHFALGSDTTNCAFVSYIFMLIYFAATWFQDYIMLTRIHIFDKKIFKKSLIVFIPLLIGRAVTNIHTLIVMTPKQTTPTTCDLGFPVDATGRQNIVKAVTYFVEMVFLVSLVFRHLRSTGTTDDIARRFLYKTVAVCVFSVLFTTTLSFLLIMGVEPAHTFIWYGLINTAISLSDSFLAQSITEAFVAKKTIIGSSKTQV